MADEREPPAGEETEEQKPAEENSEEEDTLESPDDEHDDPGFTGRTTETSYRP
ncbi:hypothetical protein [Longispora urticae]